MNSTSYEQRRQWEQLPRERLRERQRQKLNALVQSILPDNRFWKERLASVRWPLESLEQLAQLPTTCKSDLIPPEGAEPFARHLTYPIDRYSRLHRTSGTHGRPLIVLDTQDDWQWWVATWQFVLDAARVTSQDRAFMAFSFGPFVGFWSAFDALVARGVLVVPGGGLSSIARLQLMDDSQATLLCCTPSYALHLAEIAEQQKRDLRTCAVRTIIVAGEPGGSVPAIRAQIEQAWDARVVDHAGATEIGPWGYADAQGTGLFVAENAFIAEFLPLSSGQPPADTAARQSAEPPLAELVLTTLGRHGAPLIRYRTGDLVRRAQHQGDNRFVFLAGGVLGRVDDMMIIRGVNVYPSAVEQIVRQFPEIVEYRMIAVKDGQMDALIVEIEDPRNDPQRVANALQVQLGLRTDVRVVAAGSLPRFEHKGQRFVDQRNTGPSGLTDA